MQNASPMTKMMIAIAASHRGSRCMRDNRDIFVYIEIRATRLPRSTNFFLSNVRLPTDSVLNRRRIHGCQEVLEEIREKVLGQEVVFKEVRREEAGVEEVRLFEEVIIEEGRRQEVVRVFEEGRIIEEGVQVFEESVVVEEGWRFEESVRVIEEGFIVEESFREE